MRKWISLAALILTCGYLAAQEEAIYSQYYINPVLINPSYAGFSEVHRVQMGIRNQWSGFPTSPKTYGIFYNGPIGPVLGLGASVTSDNLAALSKLRMQLNYAFRYTFEDLKVSAGFSTSFQTMRLSDAGLQNEQIYDQGDRLINKAVDGTSVFDAALGFYASYKDQTFGGLSFPGLVRARLDDISTEAEKSSQFKDFILFMGHDFKISEYDFVVTPSIAIRKINNVPFGIDFNVKGQFLDDRLIAGASYRGGAGGAAGVLLGTSLQFMQLYYSYDLAFQRFQKYNAGSHEFTVAFDFEGARRTQYNRYRRRR